MEMQSPAPRRSKYNPFTPPADVDWSMTSPLLADGSNFPCKGYPAGRNVAVIKAGSTFKVQMAGTVFHMGGHCQWSVSYDGGKTFLVLKTVLNNCFTGTGLSIDVPIPKGLPRCEHCVFAWSWINAVGNREFYMNCADVGVISASKGPFTGPSMVVANLPGFPSIPEFPPGQKGHRQSQRDEEPAPGAAAVQRPGRADPAAVAAAGDPAERRRRRRRRKRPVRSREHAVRGPRGVYPVRARRGRRVPVERGDAVRPGHQVLAERQLHYVLLSARAPTPAPPPPPPPPPRPPPPPPHPLPRFPLFFCCFFLSFFSFPHENFIFTFPLRSLAGEGERRGGRILFFLV
ncbi:MAG: hypothetical protein BJ554DRAFT_8061 [Olpidium bornovanus]|uniref:Chitin-binding type-4 domain-containing protein n=1 Tax=Olpidium bornovanus TaxID=278681 RepID=A0A8H7ZUX4_9FUNG|nr:MAG: hypothetical protein BJ554DRAFT_8061 [Olpidium bornovanus]